MSSCRYADFLLSDDSDWLSVLLSEGGMRSLLGDAGSLRAMLESAQGSRTECCVVCDAK